MPSLQKICCYIVFCSFIFNVCGANHPMGFQFSVTLYNTNDHVALLNVTNFYDVIEGQNHAWLVQFYSSYCGHCINFAPTFKAFVKEIADWQHTIKPAVVNCAMLENGGLCRYYNVIAYPTLVLLPAYVKKDNLGEQLGLVRTSEQIKGEIIRYITKLQTEGHGQPHWTNLLPYSGAPEGVFESAPDSVSEGVLLMDGVNSTSARETLMNLGYFKQEMAARWMVNGTGFSRTLVPSSLPAALIVGKHKRAAPFFLQLDQPSPAPSYLTSAIIDKLTLDKKKLPSHEIQMHDKPTSTRNPEIEINLAKKKNEIKLDKLAYDNDMPDSLYNSSKTGDKVYLVDIENALVYALRQEVGVHKVIDNERLESLKNFLNTLLKYLPSRPKVHAFLSDLTKGVHHYNKVMTHSQYAEALNHASSKGLFPDMQDWIGCKGSQPHLRGFPCGLWTMFHVLTVSTLALDDKEVETGDAIDTLSAIHGFVKHFFSCRHCSEHFQEMYALDAEDYVVETQDAVLWLWKAHNKVNKRLAGDATEDPQHPKVQFPRKSVCPKCWQDVPVDPNKPFVEDETLLYLMKAYSKDSISLDNIVRPGRSRTGKKLGGRSSNFDSLDDESYAARGPSKSIFWSLSEISTCMLLYGTTTLIIGTLYVGYLLRKRIRRKRFIEMCKNPVKT